MYPRRGRARLKAPTPHTLHRETPYVRELNALGRGFPDGFDRCSMIWFVITEAKMDQTRAGKAMPLLWPRFRDVPTSKTLDDLKRLTGEIMPTVEAG